MLDRLHLHFVRKGFLAGQDMFPLDVAVHQKDDRFIVGHRAHQHRQAGDAQRLAGSFAAMAAHDLIASVRQRAGQQGREHPIFLNAFFQLVHFFAGGYPERLILKRHQHPGIQHGHHLRIRGLLCGFVHL